MRVWRIALRKFRRFDGEGARQYGGRWNHSGGSAVYTSESLSLAALELFVHFDTDLAPEDLVAIPAEIPDNVKIEHLETAMLPRNWRDFPAPEALKDIGSSWLVRNTTAIMSVPSALIPTECNYLLNPKQKDFRRIRIGTPIPFRFDPRMWK
ncbi:MAG: RES domain-containing protein [Deltaproteobacteria bacterium]|nr:RES domain-containing protein [Deltaproteobacteria bacterium]